MLGHFLEFSYCRKPGSDRPCRKIFDCWWETFDIEAFMKTHYGEEEIARIVAPPKQKAVNLAELIEKARREKGD